MINCVKFIECLDGTKWFIDKDIHSMIRNHRLDQIVWLKVCGPFRLLIMAYDRLMRAIEIFRFETIDQNELEFWIDSPNIIIILKWKRKKLIVQSRNIWEQTQPGPNCYLILFRYRFRKVKLKISNRFYFKMIWFR